MTLQNRAIDTLDRLRHALSEAMIAEDLLNAGQRLLAHLEKPAQITVLGNAGAGKTSLLNMILGSNSMPDLPTVPIVEIVHGPGEHATFEHAMKQNSEIKGVATPDNLPAGTTRVVQQLPLPVLDSRKLVEINLPEARDARKVVLGWVVKNTSITLWCSQEFDAHESALWSALPEKIKDYSFLTLTKADRLQMRGTLRAQTERFEQQFADEFQGLYLVATKRALAAQEGGQVIDKKLWAASGGKALVEGLNRQIDTGRMADLDHADLLLKRIGASAQTVPTGATATVAKAGSKTSKSRRPEQKNTPTKPQNTVAQKKPTEAVETALALLQNCADGMTETHGADADMAVGDILHKTAQTAQALAAFLTDGCADDPRLSAMREDVLESEQVILLLQLEGTETAACDAVTALLQLKKEFSEMSVAC